MPSKQIGMLRPSQQAVPSASVELRCLLHSSSVVRQALSFCSQIFLQP